MADKKYYWLKLHNDFFDSVRIKKLRRLAGGDTYTIIYLKMQLKSLKNGCVLRYEGYEDTFAKELAIDIDEDPENVQVTLNYLKSVGLLEISEQGDEYLFPMAAKCVGSETQGAERQRRCRENKRLALEKRDNVTELSQAVTDCHTEIEKEIEKEKEIEIDKDKEIEIDTASKNAVSRTDVQRVIDLWNSIDSIPSVKAISSTSKRYKSLVSRIKEYGVDTVLEAVNRIKESDFLTGRATDFVITFDWFVKPNNFPKVLEGNYSSKRKNTAGDGQQAERSMDMFEKIARGLA